MVVLKINLVIENSKVVYLNTIYVFFLNVGLQNTPIFHLKGTGSMPITEQNESEIVHKEKELLYW
jgi:hypothetical protein